MLKAILDPTLLWIPDQCSPGSRQPGIQDYLASLASRAKPQFVIQAAEDPPQQTSFTHLRLFYFLLAQKQSFNGSGTFIPSLQ